MTPDAPVAFSVRTARLDLPAVVGAFSRRLHDAGVPVTAERSARFARALTLVEPITRRRLYWTARAALVSSPTQVPAFDAVFSAVFGSAGADDAARPDPDAPTRVSAPADERPVAQREPRPAARAADLPPRTASLAAPRPERDRSGEDEREIAVPVQASDEEVLRAKRFDALEPDELAAMHHL